MFPLILLLLGQTSVTPQPPASIDLTQELYYASIDASGSRLCDRVSGKRYGKQFNRRYGARIRALIKYDIKEFGADPELITTSSCRRSYPSEQQDRNHDRAMDEFEPKLRALEQQYGLSSNDR